MIGAVFISDRGDLYLPDCVASFQEMNAASGVPTYTVDDRAHRLGMAGAVREAWQWALDNDFDYLLHVEEDFRFHRLPLKGMQRILETQPHLAQVVLKRQPWSIEERAAGGIIERHPGDYTQHSDGELLWVEHERIFSLNPCLIPRRVLELGWPDENEAGMTQRCSMAGYRFAFYGHRQDPPRVEHVGSVRGEGWRL